MITYALAASILIQSTGLPANAIPPTPAEVAASTTAQAADTAVWNNADVAAYLRTYGPDKTAPEDPFTAPPVPAESVTLTFPVPARADWLPTYWEYDRETETMTIVASEDASAAAGTSRAAEAPPRTALTMRGWALTARRSPPTLQYVGSRQVPVRVMHVTGFGQVQFNPVPGRWPDARVFRHSFSIAPENARALSEHIELRVTGKARPWRDGQWTLCVTDLGDLNSGTEVRSCFLTGVLETYQVIDRRDGSVIHTWDAR